MSSRTEGRLVRLLVAAAALVWPMGKAMAFEPPRVLLWGSKEISDAPDGSVRELYRDPAEAAEQLDHRFSYAQRGEGKLKGVDVFRDLHHRSSKHTSRRIYEGYVIGASWIHLASGRLVATFHAADPERVRQAASGQRPEHGIFDVRVMYSDDEGATWILAEDRLRAPAAPEGTNYGAVEPSVFPLLDGRLWMLIRTQVGRLYESFSSDGGEHWSTPAATPLISSDSPAERVRLPDGGIVLFLNACQHWDDPHGYAHGGRGVLHAAVSRDDGRTWRGFREIVRARRMDYARGDRGTAYPYAAATVDGKIILGTGQAKENVVLMRIDPEWLEARSSGESFRGGLDGWHVTPDGARLAETDKGPALALGGPAGDELSEAVWNFPAGAAGTLTLHLTPTARFAGGSITLTDHFSPPGDRKAIDHGLASVQLAEPGLGLTRGQAHTLRIDWDTAAGKYTVSMDGKRIPLRAQRRQTLGASYLRVRSTGPAGEAGLLIHSVEAEVQ